MHLRRLLFAVALSPLITVAAAAQQQRGAAAGRPGAGRPDIGARVDSMGIPAVERASTTKHTVMIDGKSIAYTANAGTMVVRDDDGTPKGSIFYISYTRDQEDVANRPITFFYNGGPGSASMWLSMGIMGPRHAEMAPGGMQPAPPFRLVDNPNSPLDVTDLVQIDAMNTGYSRPAPGVKATDFTGATNDIAMFGQFIRNYLTKYNRWASPKYLYGESYGTFRSAGLAAELQSVEHVDLNGVMLLGTVLDFGTIRPSLTNDQPFMSFLPTYAVTAWYHKKIAPDLQKLTIEQVAQQARDFAYGDYLSALAKGNKLTAADRSKVAQQMSRLIGISPQFILSTNLRVDPGAYRTELMRGEREMVGRLDSRMTGINGNPSSLQQDFDPADIAPTGAFVSTYMQYLQNDLGYTNTLPYYTGGHTGNWNYADLGQGYPSVAESLRSAMAKNPYLRVMISSGYYDMATPFSGAEYTFDHFGYDQTYHDRLEYKYYQSGHMAYLNPDAAKQLKGDIAQFIRSTLHPALKP